MYQFPFFPHHLPEGLKLGSCWVVCDRKKVPMVALVGGNKTASSTNPETWRPYERAIEAFETGRYAGVGRVIERGGGYVGVDIDGCRNPETGRINDRGLAILERLDSYSEVSPSGTGVKVWCKGELPVSHVKGGLEVYVRGRYFTITGQLLTQYSTAIEERSPELAAIVAEEFPRPPRNARRHRTGSYNGPRFDVDHFLEAGGVQVLAEISDASAARKYRILCPWIGDHTSAPETGTVVGQYPSGATFFHCWHSHCQHRKWRDFTNHLRWVFSWRAGLPGYTGGPSEVIFD